MLFNSLQFLFLFLPIVFICYFFLIKSKFTFAARIWLILASLYFYGHWNLLYLPLLLGSTLFNYFSGVWLKRIQEQDKRKLILFFAIASNIGLLVYYKYLDFLIWNYNKIVQGNIEFLHLILPLGISFFTFTQISYLVDSYYRETKDNSFWNYMLFVTYFPHLLSGPILNHKDMMPQFERIGEKDIDYKNIAFGIFLMALGLFKKVVIADTIAIIANEGFNFSDKLSLIEAWVTSLSYTLQLYFDFSGYTDMALGISLLFNIKLPINFNSPYKAVNIQDFWKRWHITLGWFLTNYIYIPLGGNRKGKIVTCLNLLIVFFISGIWHGAGWTFVLWGVLHGCAIVIHRIWRFQGITINKYVAWFITFNFVNFAWVFFRAKSIDSALNIIKGMIGMNGINISLNSLKIMNFQGGGDGKIMLCFLICCCLLSFLFKNSFELMGDFKPNNKYALYLSLLIFMSLIFVLSNNQVSEFLYFNF